MMKNYKQNHRLLKLFMQYLVIKGIDPVKSNYEYEATKFLKYINDLELKGFNVYKLECLPE